ncbi:MAG: hypothetical protein ACFFG0_32700 [Candidatus Thorarchaeota archaeon]
MPFIANLAQKAREKYILAGMIIIYSIAFISYVIFPSGIVYFGDIQMIIGCIVGIRFTLKNIKPSQSYFLHSIFVGLGGSILAGISFTMFDWVYFSEVLRYSFISLLIIIEFYLIEAIIIGLVMGIIIGKYFSYKSKFRIESSSKTEDFLNEFIDK